MFQITKRWRFDAAHRLDGLDVGHRCARVHGHTWTVEVTLAAERLTPPGFVTDFGDLASFGDYLAATFDHRDLNTVVAFPPTSERLAEHFANDRSLPWELVEHRRRGHDTAVASNDSSFAFWYPATATPVHAASGRATAEAPGKPDLTDTTLSPDNLRLAEQYVHLLRHAAGLDTTLPIGQRAA